MTLPAQFKKENSENIFIYHYVEEMIADYTKYVKEILDDSDITVAELPFLIRIRFSEETTQKELVELFRVSEGYTAKLLRKFEDKGYIFRCEDPTNRRKKVTKNMSGEEVKMLKSLLFKVVEP